MCGGCAQKTSEGDMSDYFAGSGWSQTYAKKAAPVLVNFAENHRATNYTELAKLLLGDKKYGHPNERLRDIGQGTAVAERS